MKNNLQKLRWEKDWSQQELQERTGISQPTLCSIENNQTSNPSVQTALLLAHALNVHVEDIFQL